MENWWRLKKNKEKEIDFLYLYEFTPPKLPIFFYIHIILFFLQIIPFYLLFCAIKMRPIPLFKEEFYFFVYFFC
jgi:hypothetical protein